MAGKASSKASSKSSKGSSIAGPKIITTSAKSPKTSSYIPKAYSSAYTDQLNSAMDKVTNRQEFEYDPLKDVNYQAMAKVYQKQGEQAARNAMGDAAALNGGYGSSYAVSASQQARNDYNQQLASQIPALYEAAYNRYTNEYNMDLSALDALRTADDTDYGRYRDNVGDKQWKYEADYQKYRDKVSDAQWKSNYKRDAYEFNKNYGLARDEFKHNKWVDRQNLKRSSSSGSGSRSGTTGSYLGSTSSSSGSSGSKMNSSQYKWYQMMAKQDDARKKGGTKR